MEAVSWLNNLTENPSKHFSLENPTALMRALGNPQDKIKSVHIAGTNGKGSTSCMTACLLHNAGHKVGQFLSPHLNAVEQRCLINGKPVESEKFFQAIEVVRGTNIAASYFEVVFAASCLVFIEESCDYIVIETGLGGRLDATNTLLKPEAAAITSISLDHQDLLGQTTEQIAWEKANIAKEGVVVFTDNIRLTERKVIEGVCSEKGAVLKKAGFYEVDLPGYQNSNARIALSIAEKILGEVPANYNQVLANVRWPGRLEYVADGKFLLDSAHNVSGVEAVVKFVGKEPQAVVFSCLAHKDWKEMGAALSRYKLYFCEFDHPRALTAKEFIKSFPDAKVINKVSEVPDLKEDFVVCLGSSYFIGELRPYFTTEFQVY